MTRKRLGVGPGALLIRSLVILMISAPSAEALAGATGASGAAGREKYLTGEAVLKHRDQTQVNFDSANILGGVKGPLGTKVAGTRPRRDYDFLRLRLRWSGEMVQSASVLDAGDGD